MERIDEDIEFLLERGVISGTRADNLKKLFNVAEKRKDGETFMIGG